MGFISSILCCSTPDSYYSSTLSVAPLMSKQPPEQKSSSQYTFKSRRNSVRDERTYSSVAEQIDPFIYSVQCTVSARSSYPSRNDIVSINSFIGYDNHMSILEQNDCSNKLHLKFRQGDCICVLGQYGGMLVGYLEKDSSRTVGFFAPNLVYVDLFSINQIEETASISSPASAYTRRIMNLFPESD